MEEHLILGFKDYATIAYLVGVVIFFWLAFRHLSKPTEYRVLFAFIVGLVWPVPAALLVMLALESLFVRIKEMLGNG
jgi:hypothetical protein